MITYILIGITLLVSFNCFSNRNWLMKLAFIPYRTVKNHEWYRLITHGFVHADSMHLLVNMFTFWSFGTYIEKYFSYMGMGPMAYIGLYFGGMIVASIFDVVKQRNNPNFISVGASGAVSAVLFSSILFDPFGKILLFAILPIPGILFGVLYLVYCQYMAKKGGDHINHNAHSYGAVFGFIYPILLNPMLLKGFLSHFGL
ncbi:rhomboid family intramembrane serine protease [Parabacteroides sp. OttesenSCG-928-O15]|nr:rhomboid family intramembrane serine protease [Parabacteroides sp. OttesenSCG-928-O15]